MDEKHRAKQFKRRCARLGIHGISLRSYRYAWAERAKEAGYPERFAQQALGHASKAVHRAYAKKAPVRVPSLEEYETKAKGIQLAVLLGAIREQHPGPGQVRLCDQVRVVLDRRGDDPAEFGGLRSRSGATAPSPDHGRGHGESDSTADRGGIVETDLFAQTDQPYGLTTVRYVVLEFEARIERFDSGRQFSLRVVRATEPPNARVTLPAHYPGPKPPNSAPVLAKLISIPSAG